MSNPHNLSALMLTLVSSAAMAAPVITTSTLQLVSDFNGGRSAGISRTVKTAGLFTDIYVIAGASGFAMLDGVLSTVGGPSTVDIDFYSASINGVAFNFTKTDQPGNGRPAFIDFRETGVFGETGLSSPFTLTLNGRAGEGLVDGANVNATYFGTVNVNANANANAVPEPASLALLLSGLLGAVAVTRRLASSTPNLLGNS